MRGESRHAFNMCARTLVQYGWVQNAHGWYQAHLADLSTTRVEDCRRAEKIAVGDKEVLTRELDETCAQRTRMKQHTAHARYAHIGFIALSYFVTFVLVRGI